MALKRVMKSSVNWLAFLERVPPSDLQKFYAFKSKSESYLARVSSLPEQLPDIDWNYYLKNTDVPELVNTFKKQYESTTIPYPENKWKSQLDNMEKETVQSIEKFVLESNKEIEKIKEKLSWWESLIPFEHMTLEEFYENFPDNEIVVLEEGNYENIY